MIDVRPGIALIAIVIHLFDLRALSKLRAAPRLRVVTLLLLVLALLTLFESVREYNHQPTRALILGLVICVAGLLLSAVRREALWFAIKSFLPSTRADD